MRLWMMSILLAPKETLAQINATGLKQPFIPAIILLLSAAGLIFAYYSLVDITWLRDQFFSRIQTDQRAIALSIITNNLLLFITVITVISKLLVWFFSLSSYFYWIDRLMGGDRSLKSWFVFTSLSYSPTLLLFPVGVLAVITAPEHRVLLGNLDTTSLSHMLGGMTDTRWQGIAANFSLLQLWPLFIQIVGVRAWKSARNGRNFDWIIAAVPTVLFYAAWTILIFVGGK